MRSAVQIVNCDVIYSELTICLTDGYGSYGFVDLDKDEEKTYDGDPGTCQH